MKTYQLVPKKLNFFFLQMNIYFDVNESPRSYFLERKECIHVVFCLLARKERLSERFCHSVMQSTLVVAPGVFSIVICH